MTKKIKIPTSTYSISEVRENMEKFLDESVIRLRAKLKIAWKKQVPLKTKVYERTSV